MRAVVLLALSLLSGLAVGSGAEVATTTKTNASASRLTGESFALNGQTVKKANAGDDQAQLILGLSLMNGTDKAPPGDPLEAVKWFRMAAEQGNAKAQFQLGRAYQDGRGVQRNYATAFEWYSKSAQLGFANAQVNLGNAYQYGRGVATNFSKAFECYLKAAEQGDAYGQFNVAGAYAMGQLVPRNDEEAFKWMLKAADQGLARAQYTLAQFYFQGRGVQTNLVKVCEWAQKAADQGHADAQHDLGTFYLNGFGVEKDPVAAYKWFTVAHRAGRAGAATGKNVAARELSPSQLVQALKQAQQFTPHKVLDDSDDYYRPLRSQ